MTPDTTMIPEPDDLDPDFDPELDDAAESDAPPLSVTLARELDDRFDAMPEPTCPLISPA